MKRVIILNGVARSGKDTFADGIIERANEDDDIYAYKMSTVDEVKEISKLFGVMSEKTDKERRLWSDLKDAWTRYNDGPFNDIVEKISCLLEEEEENTNSIYIVMCREVAEIAKFKRYYKEECMTILVKKPNTDIPNNHADMNVEEYSYDFTVHNSSSRKNFIVLAQHFADNIL